MVIYEARQVSRDLVSCAEDLKKKKSLLKDFKRRRIVTMNIMMIIPVGIARTPGWGQRIEGG